MLTFFDAMIVAHFVGDWLFQTEFEATRKARERFLNWPLAKHVLIYTAFVAVALVAYGVSPWWNVLVFTSHYFIDRRWPVEWWIIHVKRTTPAALEQNRWLVIAVDQVFHLLVLAVIATFAA